MMCLDGGVRNLRGCERFVDGCWMMISRMMRDSFE
jgi:hypothetical protein